MNSFGTFLGGKRGGRLILLAVVLVVLVIAVWLNGTDSRAGQIILWSGLILGLLSVIFHFFIKLFGSLRIITDALPVRVWVMIGILVLIAVSRPYFAGASLDLTVERTLTWLFCLFLGLLLFRLFQSTPPREVGTIALGVMMGLSVAYVAVTAGTYLTHGGPAGDFCETQVPYFQNVRYTGYFVGPTLGLAIFATTSRELSWLTRGICALVAVILWAYLEYTGSRGAVFALLAALLGVALFFAGATTIRLVIAGIVTGVAALLIMQLVPPAECHVFGLFMRTVESFETGRVTTGRTDIWALGWEMFLQRPFFGHGEIRLYQVSDFQVTQFHNVILQSLVTWGAVGGAIFLSLIAEITIRIIAAQPQGAWQMRAILFGLFVILGYSMIDATLYYAFPLVLSALLVSAAAALIRPRPGA